MNGDPYAARHGGVWALVVGCERVARDRDDEGSRVARRESTAHPIRGPDRRGSAPAFERRLPGGSRPGEDHPGSRNGAEREEAESAESIQQREAALPARVQERRRTLSTLKRPRKLQMIRIDRSPRYR